MKSNENIVKKYRVAVDGNEANVSQRVGSNVYAFEVLSTLEKLTRTRSDISWTVLLSAPPIPELPSERPGWQYRVVTPRKFWTQWAVPLHLFAHKTAYDLFFTPGHYAPRFCPVPYISSVMDTAYLEYPDHFKRNDLFQLKHWTAYSVAHARKVLTISQASKYSIVKHYHRRAADVVIAYPALTPITEKLNPQERHNFFARHGISEPYILFVGTLQPRKNVTTLITAFELLCRRYESKPETRPPHVHELPQLVLAGKVGWLAEQTLQKIARSPYRDRIILTGFISDAQKQAVIERAACLCLLGLHEGFGIPPLEALAYGTVPIVSNTTSLPEVVGTAGFTVSPTYTAGIVRVLERVLSLSRVERRRLLKRGAQQAQKFSWDASGKQILRMLLTELQQKQPSHE